MRDERYRNVDRRRRQQDTGRYLFERIRGGKSKMKGLVRKTLTAILSLCSVICICCGFALSAKTVRAATDFNITGVTAYNVNDDRFYVVLSTDTEIRSAGQQNITVSVEKSGVTEEISVTFNAFDNADIQIPTSAVAKTGEKGFVTIPKGTTAGDFVLANDYTFFIGEEIASANIYAMETDRLDTVQMSSSYARYRMFFKENAASGATDNDYYANNEAYKILNFKEEAETSTALGIVRYGVHEGKLYLRADTDDLAGVATAAQVPEMVIYVPKGAILCPNNGNYRAIIGRDIYIYINGGTIYETFRKEKEPETLTMAGFTNQPEPARFVMTLKGGAGNGTYSQIENVTALIDGAEKTISFMNWGAELSFVIPYDVLSATGKHTLEIPACKLSGNYLFAGVSLTVVDGTAVTCVTLERKGGATQEDEENDIHRYVIFFNDLGGEFRLIGNVSVTVNDTDTATAEFYQWTESRSAMLLNYSDYPVENEYKITINPCVVGDYYIENGLSFYIRNKEVSDTASKTLVSYTFNGNTVKKEIAWGEANFNSVFDASAAETGEIKIIGYTYADKLYASLSDIYAAIQGTPETLSFAVETMTLANEYGAYIRTNSDYQGLRFITKVSATKNAAVKEYGMYVTSVAFFNGDDVKGDFTGIRNGVNGYKISSLAENFNSWLKGDGYEYFSAVIDLSGGNYNREFTVCAYATVSCGEGTEKTILAKYEKEASVRSAYEVASGVIDAIEDTSSSAYAYTQKYIDGVVDIDYDYNLIGKNRSYTIEKIADGKIKLTAKAGTGFDVASVVAFSVKGVRQNATFENGVVTFDASLTAAGAIQTQIAENGKGGRKLQILAYDGPSLGIHLSEGVLTNGKYRSSTVADIKKYFDAGFNYLVADEADYGAYRYEGIEYGSGISGTKNDVERMLDLVALYCDEYGITDPEKAPVIIYWSFISAIMDKNERQKLTLNGEVRTDDNIKQLLKNAFDELCAYVPVYPEGYSAKNNGTPLNCFKGFTLRDEPYGEDLELYVRWYNYLADDMGMAENGYLLVGSVLTFGVEEKYALSGSSSDDIVSDDAFKANYLDTVANGMAANSADKRKQYLMTDPYPFYTTLKKSAFSGDVSATYYISNSYFITLQEYAAAAKAKGLKAGVALQSVTHYNKSKFDAIGSAGYFGSAECKVTGRVDKNGNLTSDENHIRYQVYTALCYGYARIDYFTYWEHFNSIAAETIRQAAVMWNYDDASGEYVAAYQTTYDRIKKANAEVNGLDEVILAFDWQGTKLISGSSDSGNCFGNATSYSLDETANTAVANYDLAVGCFTLSDTKGYMLVNADDPSNARTNGVSVDFGTGYTHAICYVKGVAEVRTLNGGKLNVTLGAGDGVFAVPVK